jgi:two-component system, chemotaxis family, protein-glutamate methylesterase/glutaminase
MKSSAESSDSPPPLRVLVVDDSAVVRQALTLILSRDGMEVTTAGDPLFAMPKLTARRPDVIVLDLEMPRMDGLTWLRQVMSEDPLPVVVCSALTGRWTQAAIQALEAGAVDVIAKPQFGVRGFLEESATVIVDAVRGAAAARMRWRRGVAGTTPGALSLPDRQPQRATAQAPPYRIVVIGASTGGTEALRTVLEAMPADGPAIALVQHMPEGFTQAFARRLNQLCAIEVKEAESGDRLLPGRALIARGNRHLVLHRSGSHYLAELADGPLVSRHRPSVDVLFQSAARVAGANALGVLMTGMGNDGAQGLLELRRGGAFTIAQDEASCVVFGMPREAVALGAVDEVIPLSRIAAAILERTGSFPIPKTVRSH